MPPAMRTLRRGDNAEASSSRAEYNLLEYALPMKKLRDSRHVRTPAIGLLLMAFGLVLTNTPPSAGNRSLGSSRYRHRAQPSTAAHGEGNLFGGGCVLSKTQQNCCSPSTWSWLRAFSKRKSNNSGKKGKKKTEVGAETVPGSIGNSASQATNGHDAQDVEEWNYTTQEMGVVGPGNTVKGDKYMGTVQATAWIDAASASSAAVSVDGGKQVISGTVNSIESFSSSPLREGVANESNVYDCGSMRRHPVVVFEECGDGACLFRSLARQVKNDEELHNEVRQEVVDFLEQVLDSAGPSRLPSDPAKPPGYPLPRRNLTTEQTKTVFKHARCFVDPKHPGKVRAYLRQMRERDTWGTSLEALAASYVYKRPVWVWMQDISGDPDDLNPEDRSSRAIGLLHVRGNHWNSAVLGDKNGNVCGRNLTYWISASMTLLRTDNLTDNKPHKYLLLRTGSDDTFKWTVPWGNVQKGETLEDTAMRRLREEVGYDVQTGDVKCQNRSFMSREMYGVKCREQPVMYVCSLFLAELCEGTSMELDPQYNASWFDPDEVKRLEERGEVQPLISKAIEQAEFFNFTPSYYDSEDDERDEDEFDDEEEDYQGVPDHLTPSFAPPHSYQKSTQKQPPTEYEKKLAERVMYGNVNGTDQGDETPSIGTPKDPRELATRVMFGNVNESEPETAARVAAHIARASVSANVRCNSGNQSMPATGIVDETRKNLGDRNRTRQWSSKLRGAGLQGPKELESASDQQKVKEGGGRKGRLRRVGRFSRTRRRNTGRRGGGESQGRKDGIMHIGTHADAGNDDPEYGVNVENVGLS
mmetsp:Transcript_21074/g.51562  ORF Transcript_21074/g.51562 Transcript_21074/m.51562 type:complete len:812 (-) Transcript_21074:205-2640(-)